MIQDDAACSNMQGEVPVQLRARENCTTKTPGQLKHYLTVTILKHTIETVKVLSIYMYLLSHPPSATTSSQTFGNIRQSALIPIQVLPHGRFFFLIFALR